MSYSRWIRQSQVMIGVLALCSLLQGSSIPLQVWTGDSSFYGPQRLFSQDTCTETSIHGQGSDFVPVLQVFQSRLPVKYRFRSYSLALTLLKLAQETNLSPALILAVVDTESSFRPTVVSSKGAIGLMQVLVPTGEFMAKKMGIPWMGKQTLMDPEQSLILGTYYLRKLIDRFDGHLESALIAYNMGPTRLARIKSRGLKASQKYSNTVFLKRKKVRSYLRSSGEG